MNFFSLRGSTTFVVCAESVTYGDPFTRRGAVERWSAKWGLALENEKLLACFMGDGMVEGRDGGRIALLHETSVRPVPQTTSPVGKP